jgi:hypothetical protein
MFRNSLRGLNPSHGYGRRQQLLIGQKPRA